MRSVASLAIERRNVHRAIFYAAARVVTRSDDIRMFQWTRWTKLKENDERKSAPWPTDVLSRMLDIPTREFPRHIDGRKRVYSASHWGKPDR